MFYLILAILSSMLVSVVMRISQTRCKNQLTVLAMNYVTCALMAGLFVGGPLWPQGEGSGFALGMGLVSGALYLAGFLLLQYNIQVNGVVLSSTFMKLGVTVPTLMSLAFFGESLSLPRAAGLVLAVASICLIGTEKGRGKARHLGWLVMVLFSGGLCDGTSKIYEELGVAAFKNHFLFFTFVTALIMCVALCIAKKQTITLKEIVFGLALGIPNYFSARFLLLSLSQVDAVVAYPTFSVGTIVTVSLAGLFFFKEKLSKRQLVAMGVILTALVLLNA